LATSELDGEAALGLPFVFADAEDERAQYTMLIGQVAARRPGRLNTAR
jgi:hypothetical protein